MRRRLPGRRRGPRGHRHRRGRADRRCRARWSTCPASPTRSPGCPTGRDRHRQRGRPVRRQPRLHDLRRRRQRAVRQRQRRSSSWRCVTATIRRTAPRTRAPSPRASSTPATAATTCCSWAPSGAASSASTSCRRRRRRARSSRSSCPPGLGPEGLLAIPERDLFVVSSARPTTPPIGVRTTISIYRASRSRASLPAGRLRRRARRHADPVERAVGAGRRPGRPGHLLRRLGLVLRREPHLHRSTSARRRPS